MGIFLISDLDIFEQKTLLAQIWRLDKIPKNMLHFKVAPLYPCDNSSNCTVGAPNFSFLALELTVGLSFSLQEVSSCPPFSGRLLTDKLRAFGEMLSSSRARLQLWQPAAPAKGSSYLHYLLWVSNAQRWGNCFSLPCAGFFSACSSVSLLFD